MDERQALLRAVIEEPDHDAPRLVFADWLDEFGTTEADRGRAALIRLQVEAARLERYEPRRLDLEGQAAALVLAHRDAWLVGLEDFMVNKHPSSFDRGFPFVLQVTVKELLTRGDELWTALPFRRLTIWEGWRDGGAERFGELTSYAPLARIRALSLSGVP